MICARISSRSSGMWTALTEPTVPTGMKIGVRISPWSVSMRPARAAVFVQVLWISNFSIVVFDWQGALPEGGRTEPPKLLWNAKIRHLRQYLPMASKALLQALFRPSERPFSSPLLRRLGEGFSGGKKDARRRAKIFARKKIIFCT